MNIPRQRQSTARAMARGRPPEGQLLLRLRGEQKRRLTHVDVINMPVKRLEKIFPTIYGNITAYEQTMRKIP